MAGVVSGVAKAVTVICDMLCAVDSASKVVASAEDNRDYLATASLINRLVLLGFSIGEVSCLAAGSKSQTLATLKKMESLPRALNMPIQFSLTLKEETKREAGGFRGVVRIIEKGLLAPIADVCRVSAEAEGYQAKAYLEMTPEELAKVKVPIYRMDGETVEIVGYKPVDLKECQTDLESSRTIATAATYAWTAAEFETVGTTLKILPRLPAVYQRLVRFFNPNPILPHAERGNNAPDAFAEPELIRRAAEIDLLTPDRIPLPLHDDAIFRQYICQITSEPIRDPVRDPNGHTLYERSAINNWLQISQTSPVTRLPMQETDLQEMPALKALIDHRLRFHQENLRRCIVDALNAPVDDPALQAAAHGEHPDT